MTSESAAYSMRLETDPGAPPSGPSPRSDAAATAALAALQRMVVEPVVAGLLRDDELDVLEVGWGEDADAGEVWVRVVARGEEFWDVVLSPAWPGSEPLHPEALAARLAEHLQDWLSMTRFAWGQRRIARYTMPGS